MVEAGAERGSDSCGGGEGVIYKCLGILSVSTKVTSENSRAQGQERGYFKYRKEERSPQHLKHFLSISEIVQAKLKRIWSPWAIPLSTAAPSHE